MQRYKSYHTAVKTSYALGIQNQVLSDSFINSIPRSTSQSWKDVPADKFVGGEFASQIETDLEQLKVILDERLRKIRVAFYCFARLYLTIIEFIGKKNFEKIILQNKESVIDLVNNLPVEFNRDLVCKFYKSHRINLRFGIIIDYTDAFLLLLDIVVSDSQIKFLKKKLMFSKV